MKKKNTPCIPTSIDQLDLHHIAIGSGCVADTPLPVDHDIAVLNDVNKKEEMNTKINASINKRTIDMAVFSFLFSVAIFCFSVLVFTGKPEKSVNRVNNLKSKDTPVFAADRQVIKSVAKKASRPVSTEVKALANATKVDMVKVQQPANPNLPFESFGVMVADGVANIRWTDKEAKAVTYMVEKSEDGTNYEIYSVTDGMGSNVEPTEQTFNQTDSDPGQYYRLLKIVHGGAVYEGNARGVIKTKQADIASMQSHGTTTILAFVHVGR